MVEAEPSGLDLEICPHLLEPLFEWCLNNGVDSFGIGADGSAGRGTQICVELRLTCRDIDDLRGAVQESPDLLIDLVDWIIRSEQELVTEFGNEGFVGSQGGGIEQSFQTLDTLLERGGSAWKVDRELPGLSLRVSVPEQNLFEEATEPGDSASRHLRTAWAAAWGSKADGQKAYDETVKALEAALRKDVSPDNETATLGTVLGDIASQQGRFSSRLQRTRPLTGKPHPEFEDAGLQLVHGVADSIWRAHHRHGNSDRRVVHDVEQGRDAVTIAVALIAIQRRGFLTRF
ncbi:MAG: hypothetical protein OXD50_04630 [Chloroflexi bacterium]|nr:hypothetical protein [Chloroflexota bacterium]